MESIAEQIDGLNALRDRLRKDLGTVERMLAAAKEPRATREQQEPKAKPVAKPKASKKRDRHHSKGTPETRGRILTYLASRVTPATAGEISVAVGMNHTTARSVSESLAEEGLIRSAGYRTGGRGTRPKTWAAWPTSRTEDNGHDASDVAAERVSTATRFTSPTATGLR